MSDANRTFLRYRRTEVDGSAIDATGAYHECPRTSDSLSQSSSYSSSQTIRSDRNVEGMIRTSVNVEGDVAFELSYAAYDNLIESALMSTAWTSSVSDITDTTTEVDVTGSVIELRNTTDGKYAVITAGVVVRITGFSAAANSGYASDITRTAPVGGKFTEKQKPIYEAVLKAEVNAIKACKPGVPYRDIHLQAARSMTSDMKALGLMKGDVDEAVAAGAHAIFFPHGLGHMMGLDVHDMEGLGEDLVGYDASVRRSDQFGLKWLRLARPLEPGFVLTVEPGIYFIPTLIDQWKAEGRHKDFINYEKFEAYKGLGGVRIEDDVLVTRDGHRVLGKPIPKSVSEVEAITATGL